MRKNVFLAYVYSSKNAGDLAICVGAIDLLIKAGFKVTLLSKYDKNDNEYFSSKLFYEERYGKDLVFLEAPFTLNRDGSWLNKLINNLKGLYIYAGGENSRVRVIKKYIKESDFLIFNGGNLLRCAGLIDFGRLLALYYPIKLGLRSGKSYVIFPQSVAKIKGVGTKLLTKFMSEAKTLFVREQQSYDKLKDRFNLNNIVPTIDLAYFIEKDTLERSEEKSNTIAITLRAHTIGDIQEFGDGEKEKIYRTIFDFLQNERYQNYEIVFVVQTKKDLEFSKLVAKRLLSDLPALCIDIFESYDPIELLSFYNKIKLLVGMRLHSIILASSIGVPCYGLFYREWGLKNPGLMENLKMPYTIMDENPMIDIENGIEYLLKNDEKLSRLLIEKVTLEQSRIIRKLDEKIG